MDRRRRKTRIAIFEAFTELLSKKDFNHITVAEIIDNADVGRATFYSHFETKDFLLKELCDELFCHIFDAESDDTNEHEHIFECETSGSAFLHMFLHLQKNDNNILSLLSSRNNELFLSYFRSNLDGMIENHIDLFQSQKGKSLPEEFWKNHIATTFIDTIRWWIGNGMKETPEEISKYFFEVV